MALSSILYVLLGMGSGVLSGFMGIGGGIVIVPCLVYLFGFKQHLAQGTTLALMVPPIGILAAWKYYQNGQVDVYAATFIVLGFLLGSLVGANMAVAISNRTLSLCFGIILIGVGAYIIWENA